MMTGSKPKFMRQKSAANAVEAAQMRDDARVTHLRLQRKQHLAENPFTEKNARKLQHKYSVSADTLKFLKNVKTDSFGWGLDGIRARIPALKKVAVEEWDDWIGSPSTVRTLSFSRTSNAKIKNTQEWPKISSNASVEKKQREMKTTKKMQKLTRGMTMTAAMLSAGEQRKEWEDADTSDRDMVFSKTVRYHPAWRNPQELPDAEVMHEEWLEKNMSRAEIARERKACHADKTRRLVPRTEERPVRWEVVQPGKAAAPKKKSKRKLSKGALGAPPRVNNIPWNHDMNLGAPEKSVNFREPITAYRMKRVPPKMISGRVLEKLEEEKIQADPVAGVELGYVTLL